MLLRPLTIADEAEFLRAHRATTPSTPSFLHFYEEGMPIERYIQLLADRDRGVDLPSADSVPSSFLFAFVGERIVGRVSIRHRLNARLERVGGHIGYAVVPEFRRRGYATSLLHQALCIVHDRLGIRRALVTCDDANAGSIKVIERNGGVMQDIVADPDDGHPVRRYWIELGPRSSPWNPC